MSRTARNAVATRNGSWLLTLYAKADGSSFVHALDLRSGIAHCIDLPLRGDYGTVSATALTLSPDEQRLYLASPLLGRITTVDMRTLGVSSVTRFKGVGAMTYTFGIGRARLFTERTNAVVRHGAPAVARRHRLRNRSRAEARS